MAYCERGLLWDARVRLIKGLYQPTALGACKRGLDKLASDLMYDLGFLEDTCANCVKVLEQEEVLYAARKN